MLTIFRLIQGLGMECTRIHHCGLVGQDIYTIGEGDRMGL